MQRSYHFTVPAFYGPMRRPIRDTACRVMRRLPASGYESASVRIKTKKSACEKLEKRGCAQDARSAVRNLRDVIGIRIIVDSIPALYRMTDRIRELWSDSVICEKDYVQHAKESGYRSYHTIIELTDRRLGKVCAEIQMRTPEMDAWASEMHDTVYKPGGV